MSLILSGIKTNIDEDNSVAILRALKKLGVSSSAVNTAIITKTSIDARKQSDIKLVHSIEVSLNDEAMEAKILSTISDGSVRMRQRFELKLKRGETPLSSPPVVIGFGPAGMFAGLLLARYGYRPIIIERGGAVDDRVKAVEGFWSGKGFNSTTNVQFGEGGAGTFSDGKLTTRINDERCEFVLNELYKHGAPDDILVKAKPHIGTDKLRLVVKSIREEIISLGGEVRFNEQLIDFTVKNGNITAIKTTKAEIETSAVVLAIGHSARDTFNLLHEKDILIESKAFSVGVRIEHLQSEIDNGLYGKLAGHKALSVGEYQLSHREQDRAVYTFCMCPGGLVVPSSSEENTIVVNGMSEYARDRKNANSALVVSVDSRDYGNDWDSGIQLQRQLEQTAYRAGKGDYKAPAQTVDCFLNEKCGLNLKRVEPSYALGVTPCSFDEIFPKEITSMLRLGLREFDRKIKGFAALDTVLTGVETRTSSPVRITRTDSLNSSGTEGMYPCGEGAGYAGGIMSAAVDGIRVAEAIIARYKAFL